MGFLRVNEDEVKKGFHKGSPSKQMFISIIPEESKNVNHFFEKSILQSISRQHRSNSKT